LKPKGALGQQFRGPLVPWGIGWGVKAFGFASVFCVTLSWFLLPVRTKKPNARRGRAQNPPPCLQVSEKRHNNCSVLGRGEGTLSKFQFSELVTFPPGCRGKLRRTPWPFRGERWHNRGFFGSAAAEPGPPRRGANPLEGTVPVLGNTLKKPIILRERFRTPQHEGQSTGWRGNHHPGTHGWPKGAGKKEHGHTGTSWRLPVGAGWPQ